MIPTYTQQNKVFFYTLMVILAGLSLWLVSGYLDIIVFSLVMVVILKPVYNHFNRLFRGRARLATTATIVAFFVAVLIPSWLMIRVVINQINAIIGSFSASPTGQPLTLVEFQVQVNNLAQQIPYADQIPGLNNLQLTDQQMAQFNQILQSATVWLGQFLVNLGMSIPDLMARLFIFLAILGVLLPNYHRFVQRLLELSPLADEVDWLYLSKIKAMVWSMFIGIVVIALAQGVITGLFFWLGNVPYTLLWTLIAIILSTLPLGASLIAIPVAIIEIIMGNYVSGLIVLGGYLLVVSNVDSILRPRLVSKEAYLDAALVLVASLGGYDLFGFFGVVYGPVLMVLAITTIEVYSDYYADRRPAAAPEAEARTLAPGSGETPAAGQTVSPDDHTAAGG